MILFLNNFKFGWRLKLLNGSFNYFIGGPNYLNGCWAICFSVVKRWPKVCPTGLGLKLSTVQFQQGKRENTASIRYIDTFTRHAINTQFIKCVILTCRHVEKKKFMEELTKSASVFNLMFNCQHQLLIWNIQCIAHFFSIFQY